MLHDLHESVPYLYDNTIGDEPYNAWVDPILTDEWQMIGWHNVSEMTKFGMPGVFTHGNFDTWSPGYLMFIAATHNGISRLYETFGNGGADTLERTLSPAEYQRTWYKQNPPLPKAKWSQRNNNNYEETALLISLDYFVNNRQLFLKNFYLKSKRSVLKPKNEGPAAYVLPGDDPRPGNQAELLRTLQAQGAEISRATAPFTVPMKKKSTRRVSEPRAVETGSPNTPNPAATPSDAVPRASMSPSPASSPASSTTRTETETRTFPAGTYIVRMDQPYSRIADALLDYQYWSPSDPQSSIYDDTAWTMGELGNVEVVRVTDTKVLDAAMERVSGEVRSPGGVNSSGSVFVINHNGDNALATLRYQSRLVHHTQSVRRRIATSYRQSRRTGLCRRRCAGGENSSREGRARCRHAHVAEHAGRRMVAFGARSIASAIHLHQHAGRRERGRPQEEIRRDHLCSCRPRRGGDH